MGWSFNWGIHAKSDMVAYLTRPELFGDEYELVRFSVVGNNLWYLSRRKVDDQILIGLDLMEYGGKKMGWGHKGSSETSGPSEVNCPLSFLAEASAPTGYAIAWRQAVRQYHANRAARAKLKPGDVVTFDGAEYRMQRPAEPRRGWIVERVSDGKTYRMNARQFARLQPPPIPVPTKEPEQVGVALVDVQYTLEFA